MKYCSKCGAQLEEDKQFCGNCGMAITKTDDSQSGTTQQLVFGKWDKKRVLIGIGAIILVGIVIWFFRRNTGSYETPIKNYFAGIEESNYSLMCKAFSPDAQKKFERERFSEEEFESTRKKITKTFGNDYNISYIIMNPIEYTQQSFQELMTYLSQYISTEKISKAYQVNVELTETGSKRTITNSLKFIVYKQDGSWYLYPNF